MTVEESRAGTADEAICFRPLHEIARMVADGVISPVEVIEAHLARCERLNPTLNAFITVAAEKALDTARRAGRTPPAGPLHGVPVGIKDVFDTEGVRTTYGSSFYRDHVPGADAVAVARLKAAGAIVIGKCNTHEFAGGSTTNNPWYGAARNPWALERSPGGSSGGSGAATAAFLCAGATGSDTGGSVRAPAACNGIVGLKPTFGLVSQRGIFPNSWSLNVAGPIVRTARDAALMLGAMAGYDPEDPTSVDRPAEDYGRDLDKGVQGLRVAFCPDLHISEVDDEVLAALETAGRTLAGLGAGLSTVTFADKALVRDTSLTLHQAEFHALHRERLLSQPDGYGADVRANLEAFGAVTAGAYQRASYDRLALRRQFDRLMEEVDAIIIPTAPCVAPLSEDGSSTVNGATVNFGQVGVAMRIPINMLGVPAVAVPIGFSGGLPISMQIIGRAWDEATILRIAHAYQLATPELGSARPPHC